MDDDAIVVVDDDEEEKEEREASRWSAAQELAMAALIAGAAYGEAATAAGVSSRTVARWMSDPAFRGEVEAGKAARVARVTGQLLDAANDAVAVLVQECRQADRSADRIRAAGNLLAHGLRYRSQTEVE